MSTMVWNENEEDELAGEPSAEMSVDWIEDDLQQTPVAEITLIDERDVLSPPIARRAAVG